MPEQKAIAGRPADEFTNSWRYKAGLGLIIFGHVILILGVLSPMFGVGAGTASVMVLGGELIGLSSIVILGKEGFMAIKSRLLGFVKADFAGPVGRARHRIGIMLICTNVVTLYVLMFYAWIALELSLGAEPVLEVWGLSIEQQKSMVFWLFLVGEFSFLVGIYTLGAEWWGRFRALFVWNETESSAGGAG